MLFKCFVFVGYTCEFDVCRRQILTYKYTPRTAKILMAVAGDLVQWFKLPAWNVGGRGFKPRSGIQVSKKQNVSSLLTHKDSILWEASVIEK